MISAAETKCSRPGCGKLFVGGASCAGRRFCSLYCADIDPELIKAREAETFNENGIAVRDVASDPVLAAADVTCVECGEVGHFDCLLRDPEARKAAPGYAALMRMIGGAS